MINIKFFPSSNNLSLDKISLSPHNPRYTLLESLDDNLINIIRNTKNESEEKIKNKLLEHEGDFFDLKNLLESILDIGFDTKSEPIILIKNDDKYVIAEGNRRTMCLKFIFGKLLLDNNIKKINSIQYQEDIKNEDDHTNDNYISMRSKNYKEILKIIKEIREKYENKIFECHTKIISDNDELWKKIYTKHIAGERPGMREWNRGKYFADMLSFIKHGIKLGDTLSKKIRKRLQREPSKIITDFKHAQFIKEILRNTKIYGVPKEKVNDFMIFEIMKRIKITALQSNFSLKRIKDSAKENLNISNEIFENKYLKYIYDDNNLIKFLNSNKKSEIFEFIYENYSEGIITTRPIKNKNKNIFDLGVKKILSNDNINTKEKQDEETLKKIDSFCYGIKQLNEIINTARHNGINPEIIKKFEATKSIKENNRKLKKSMIFSSELEDPSQVFDKLHQQYLHNQKKDFLNAMASTMRSILEQIIIWGSYFNDDILNKVVEGSDAIDVKRDSYIKKLSEHKIHSVFRKIKTNNFNFTDLCKILESIIDSKFSFEKIASFISDNKEEIDTLLNEFIHASHRIYISMVFNDNLYKFSKWQENIILIIDNIKVDKINIINEKIKIFLS